MASTSAYVPLGCLGPRAPSLQLLAELPLGRARFFAATAAAILVQPFPCETCDDVNTARTMSRTRLLRVLSMRHSIIPRSRDSSPLVDLLPPHIARCSCQKLYG